MLNLSRPFAILDLEATGTDPSEAHIIQIAIWRHVPNRTGIEYREKWSTLIDPLCDIPARITDLTGITTEDVTGEPLIVEVADTIESLIGDADLCGYNALSYDVPLLEAEWERHVGGDLPGPEDRVVVDPYQLEKVLVPRDLASVYKRRTGLALDGAHDAMTDVIAARDVLLHQLLEIGDEMTPASLADLARGDYLDDGQKLKRRDDGAVKVCFGKHRGQTLRWLHDNDPTYFDWMYSTVDGLAPIIDCEVDPASDA